MFRFPDFTDAIQDFLQCELAISPWLVSPEMTERFDADLFHLIDYTAKDLERLYWSPEVAQQIFGNHPFPERIARTTIYETIASTAVQYALLKRGEFFVDEGLLDLAIHQTEAFIATRGIDALVGIYSIITSYENHEALTYYGQIPERIFNSGEWHRPWVDYSLSDELMLGAVIGSLRLVIRDRQRMVELTDCGRQFFAINKETLKKSGYLEYRKNMLQIAHLNHMEDFEELESILIPQSFSVRREFLDWINIAKGTHVLEVGCGSGTFIFSTGLAEKIGETGHITGIDPATGMLAHAELTRRLYGIDWISFQRASAEQIPFPDGSFDATIGVGFLQFSDLQQAVKEMARVTKMGGFIASLHALEPNELPDFYRQWFQPIIDLELTLAPHEIKAFPQHNQVSTVFYESGLEPVDIKRIVIHLDFSDPDRATEFFIYGLGIFQEILTHIPWQARLDLVAQLKRNGETVKAHHGTASLRFPITIQMVKSIKRARNS